MNDSNVEMGWTELSISSVSAYSMDEANAERGGGQEEAIHPAEMVARRFDELCKYFLFQTNFYHYNYTLK